MKKTLKEVAKKYGQKVWGVYFNDIHPDIAINKTLGEISIDDFIAGANWQKERILSNIEFKKITVEELNYQDYQPFITDDNGNIWVVDKEKLFRNLKK